MPGAQEVPSEQQRLLQTQREYWVGVSLARHGWGQMDSPAAVVLDALDMVLRGTGPMSPHVMGILTVKLHLMSLSGIITQQITEDRDSKSKVGSITGPRSPGEKCRIGRERERQCPGASPG